MGKILNSSVAKAERLIQLRKLAKLSRKDTAQMAGVSVSTYKGWENARFGGIPLKRAVLLTDTFQAEGIKSSVNWLIHGAGDQPKKILCYQITQFKEAIAGSAKQQSPEAIEQLRIKAELEFFCNNNDWTTLSLIVPDDAMAPYFLPGDFVAGVKVLHENFDATVGLNCIARTKNNKILLRQIQKSSTKDLFTLLCLNPNCKQQFILHDAELVDIAPVLWFRRNATSLIKTPHKE